MSLPPPPPALDDAGTPSPGSPGQPVVRAPRSNGWRLVGLGAAAAAGCAYVAMYDPEGSTSALYPGCPFNAITGWDCPGCGMTRATHALFTGRPLDALDHNLLYVVLLPFLAWWVLRSVVRSFGKEPPGPTFTWRPWMTGVAIVAVGAFWVARNVPAFGWLASGLS